MNPPRTEQLIESVFGKFFVGGGLFVLARALP